MATTESTDGNVVGVVWRSSVDGGEAVFDADESATSVAVVADAPTGVAATDEASIEAAIATAVAAGGGEVLLQVGLYLTGGEITVPGGVTIVGQGLDLGGRHLGSTSAPTEATIVRASAAITSVFKLSETATNLGDDSTFLPGNTGASLRNLVVDGVNTATSAVRAIGPRWQIDRCQIMRGATQALLVSTGQNGYCRDTTLAQNNTGNVVTLSGGSSGADNKFVGCQIRGMATNKAGVSIDAPAVEIRNCHIFRNANYNTAPQSGVSILSGSRHTIVGNVFDQSIGHHINVTASGGAIDSVVITGNIFYWVTDANFPDDTYSVIAFDASQSNAITNFTITGNVARSDGAARRYKAFLRKFGATATMTGIVAVGNVVTNAVTFADFTLAVEIGNFRAGAAQEIGFFGTAAATQPAAIADATDAASAITQLNLALAALRTLGLIAT